MAVKYFYKNQDIYYLTTMGNQPTVPSGSYPNFPMQLTSPNNNYPAYKTTVTNPLPLGYKIGDTDLNNYCTAYSITPPVTDTVTSLNLLQYTNIIYKHISAIGWGGGGGGGGGGGVVKVNVTSNAGNGGAGSPGNYAGVVKVPFNSSINYTVGTGGNGGGGGSSKINLTTDGTPGGVGKQGGDTTLNIDNNPILIAQGGPGGNGGGGVKTSRTPYSSGTPGNTPVTPASIVYQGNPSTISDLDDATVWPQQNTGNGGGGGGQANNPTPAGPGSVGGPGYLTIYFLYE